MLFYALKSIAIEFDVHEDGGLFADIYAWRELVFNPRTGTIGGGDSDSNNCFGSMRMIFIRGDAEINEGAVFEIPRCYVNAIQAINLDMGDKSGQVKLSVDFMIQRAFRSEA